MIITLLKFVTQPILDLFFCFKNAIIKRSIIFLPLRIDGKKNIYIGKHVSISYKAWLAALPLTGKTVQLIINDYTIIGNFAHIYATKSIIIGKNVLIADRVYISDNLHGYNDINIAIMKQPIVQKKSVSIGDDSWIGENVCIIGASIGKHCIVGANAVVTKDIPDYSVAVGNPAKVIKQYNSDNKCWEKI